MFENIKESGPSNPCLILSITFDWNFEISNGFLEIEDSAISQLFYSSKPFEKNILLCQNEVQSSSLNTISNFLLN